MSQQLSFDLDAEELEVFCQEAEEMISQLDSDLLAVEAGDHGLEIVGRMFRSAHTLKGSAGAIGHERMANLTHCMENILELLRQNKISPHAGLVDLLLESVDALRALNGEVVSGTHSGVEPESLISRLKALDGRTGIPPGGPTPPQEEKPTSTSFAAGEESTPRLDSSTGESAIATPDSGCLTIEVEIDPQSFAPSVRALQVLLALDGAGTIVESRPGREIIEKGECDTRIDIVLATSRSPQELRQMLARVGDLSRIEVSGGEAPMEEDKGPAAKNNNNGSRQGKTIQPSGNMKTVRTSVERLDKLMNLVGELVTDRNRLLQTYISLRNQFEGAEFLTDMAQGISHLATITDELQEEVMRARMLPLDNVFHKFPRLVRDTAREAGKSVSLEIHGQETELDRSVIEEIADPLMHLLRNAVDHGIESPAERQAAGKPETGTIRLAARSEGNHIIITVSDDGRGVDPEKVRCKAIERGFLTEEAAGRLSENEVLDMIFLPGLSTAKTVTDISGRGVGMDVVRTNIERLRGSVSVKSTVGVGTAFEMSLPLTLAIMPVLVVTICKSIYCIPLSSVTEVLEVEAEMVHVVDRGDVVSWRDRLLPLLHLRRYFRLDHGNGDGIRTGRNGRFPVVAVRNGEDNVGLIVDDLIGQQEIVIKGLGRLIGQVPGISGGTILGDGSVGLIVDVPALTKRVSRP